MKLRSLALVSAAILTVTAFSAHAETPEEVIAYTFLGLSGDAVLDRGKTHLTWHKAADSPAVYVGHGEGGGKTYDVTFTVTAVDNCDFEIQLAGPAGMVRDGKALYARIDLSEITSISAGEFQTAIEGDGYCQTGTLNPNCTIVHNPDIFGKLDTDKHVRLVSQLPIAACQAGH